MMDSGALIQIKALLPVLSVRSAALKGSDASGATSCLSARAACH